MALMHRLPSSIATCLGLVYAASALVHFTDRRMEAHLHWFAVLALASPYVDVRPIVAAVWTGAHVVFVVLPIGALAINRFTLQAQHQRWLHAMAEQRELIARQLELAEQSAALAEEQERNLRS